MLPVLTERFAALEDAKGEQYAIMVEALLEAMEHGGTAALCVDRRSTGRAEVLIVGDPVNTYQLLSSTAMEMHTTYIHRPEGATLQ